MISKRTKQKFEELEEKVFRLKQDLIQPFSIKSNLKSNKSIKLFEHENKIILPKIRKS